MSCDLVFLDPDNGLEISAYEPGRSKAGKSVALSELQALRRSGRTLTVHHHQTRMLVATCLSSITGAKRLGAWVSVNVIRASSFSARAFFILNELPEVRCRAKAFGFRWDDMLSLHPGLGLNATNQRNEQSKQLLT